MKRQNGFTMVELLVSLVLITTLLVVLFKTVTNIQKKSNGYCEKLINCI